MRDQHVLMWQSLEILSAFYTLTLKQIFWKTWDLLKKLEFHFLVKSYKIENAAFPYKTGLPEANVKTKRMWGTKWIYHKGRSFAKLLYFFENFVSDYETRKELIWCTNHPNVHIHTFRKSILQNSERKYPICSKF